jgi:ribose 5-phosphate isomerase A
LAHSDSKREAAEAALSFLPERGIIGLGSGSTAFFFIEAVARLVKSGRQLVGVATSQASRQQAEALGISVLGDEGPWDVDVCVDGADEVSEGLDLIKGGGGCHSREKIVNQAARRNVIVVDESKLSSSLGEKWPVPVEVLPFGMASTRVWLSRFGSVSLRQVQREPFITDSGNHIFDLHAGVIRDPAALDRDVCGIPGVVETGLFIQRADVVLVAGPNGVRRLQR